MSTKLYTQYAVLIALILTFILLIVGDFGLLEDAALGAGASIAVSLFALYGE